MAQSAKPKLRFGLWYDFRNPPQWRRPYREVYGEVLDQMVWADQSGFDDIWLSEHHFSDDGYSPSLLPISAAIAARTTNVRIITGLVLMPFHNPVRLAEDIATVDVISNGRFELGVGPGYRVEEFEGFSVPFKERGRRTNESLEIIQRLWQGETLTYKSRFFEFNKVRLTPEPIQKPRLPVWIGGVTEAAMRRVARYGDGFFVVTVPARTLYDRYVAELKKVGKPVEGALLAGGYFWLIPSNDPEKTWNEAADHVIYQLNKYYEWFTAAGHVPVAERIRDRDDLRRMGWLHVADPEGCIRMIREYIADVPLTHYVSWALPPGLPASWAQPHLELFAKKVIPAFR